MRSLKYVGLLGLFVVLAGAMAPAAHAQVRVAVGIGVGVPPPVYVPAPVYVGPPPVCPYGYYGYYPYACAPYGYYAPRYFVNGVFIGAGPWFHGFHREYYAPQYRYFGRGYDRDHDRGFRDEGFREFRNGHEFHGEDRFRGNGREGHREEFRGGEHGHGRR